jgi:hypothetical protein
VLTRDAAITALELEIRDYGEKVAYEGKDGLAIRLIRWADTLSALGGRDGKATGLVIYDQLKDLWGAMAFNPETMPVPIMREACKVTKETLDAMLKGFEGKSFRQWCDEQWSDGIPEPAALGGRPETGPCYCCRGDRASRDGHPAFCQPGCECYGRCDDPSCCEPDPHLQEQP